jgi:hypothetical protein
MIRFAVIKILLREKNQKNLTAEVVMETVVATIMVVEITMRVAMDQIVALQRETIVFMLKMENVTVGMDQKVV